MSLEGDGWYYTRSTIQRYTYNEPELVDREVVAIRYDASGTVAAVDRFGIEDGRIVPLAVRTTETFGNEQSAFRQLIGNLFNIQVDE